jgi:hypothetical protein
VVFIGAVVLVATFAPSVAAQTTTTREAFAMSANQICRETSAAINARAKRATGRAVIDPAKPRSSARIIKVTDPLERTGLRRLAELPRPAGDEMAIQLWVDGSHRAIDTLRKIGRVLADKGLDALKRERRYDKLIDRGMNQSVQALANVQAFGLTDCGGSG